MNFLQYLGWGWWKHQPAAVEPTPEAPSVPLEIPEVVEVPIEWELDLHTFRPSEARSVVDSYLVEAACRGFSEVRIIHGKGQGHMRRNVQSLLAKHPQVVSFCPAPPELGGWGATLVRLKVDRQGPASGEPSSGGQE